jgi:hypothetical protein
MAVGQLDVHMQKNKTGLWLHPIHKSELEMDHVQLYVVKLNSEKKGYR